MKTICVNQSLDCWMQTAHNWAAANPFEAYVAMTVCLMSFCYWSVMR